MVELIDDLEAKDKNLVNYLGMTYGLFYNKILVKTLKKQFGNNLNLNIFCDISYLKNNFEEFLKLKDGNKHYIWKKILNILIKDYINQNNFDNKSLILKHSNDMINDVIDNINTDQELLDLWGNEEEKKEIFGILISNKLE